MKKDRIERRIGRVIAWRVFRFKTYHPRERTRLAHVGKQAVKSNRPKLNHAVIALETSIALQRREDAITIQVERLAWQILGDWQ
jgi:hypothetical protein